MFLQHEISGGPASFEDLEANGPTVADRGYASPQPRAHRDLEAQLFADLTHDRIGRRLARLDFAARKFPLTREPHAGATPGNQALATANDRRGGDPNKVVRRSLYLGHRSKSNRCIGTAGILSSPMLPPLEVRFGRTTDVEAARQLNDGAVPAVNALDGAAWIRLVQRADLFAAATDAAGALLGFVVALGPGHDYESENYRWFQREYPDPSLYVDRIVVASEGQGRGIGRALYDVVFEEAGRRGLPFVTCEVNERPPNPGSLAFHTRLGFREAGRQEASGKLVILLERAV